GTWEIATRTLVVPPAPSSRDITQAKPATPPPVVKPPSLKAFFGETSADQATFVVAIGKDGTLTLPAVEVKNSGGSDAPSPRLRLFFSEAIENPGFGWEPVKNTEKGDRKSTRLNSSHVSISYAVFCLKKKNNTHDLSLSTN